MLIFNFELCASEYRKQSDECREPKAHSEVLLGCRDSSVVARDSTHPLVGFDKPVLFPEYLSSN